MDNAPKLGELLPAEEFRRDCVHVAIAPVTASVRMRPGCRVGLSEDRQEAEISSSDECVGIVDPFLTEDVLPGQRFWLVLFPGSITGLRHVWQSPGFTAARKEPS